MYKSLFNLDDFVPTPLSCEQILEMVVKNFVRRRKELKITQRVLSKKTGIPLATICVFEQKGKVSLHTLIKLSKVLNGLDDFEKLFENEFITSVKDYKPR